MVQPCGTSTVRQNLLPAVHMEIAHMNQAQDIQILAVLFLYLHAQPLIRITVRRGYIHQVSNH